jgi:hypothetical protein
MKPAPHCKQHGFFHPDCIECQVVKRNAKRRACRERRELRESLGLVKAKDSIGRTLWE